MPILFLMATWITRYEQHAHLHGVSILGLGILYDMDLAQKKCVACEGGAVPLTRMEAEAMLTHVSGWALAEDAKSISRSYRFNDFAQALSFANKIGDIAQQEGHHPDMCVSWGKLKVDLSTHAIGGLSENDFILAAKIDRVSEPSSRVV